MPVVVNAAVDAKVAAYAAKVDPNFAQNCSDVVDYINACVNRTVDFFPGAEGLTVKGGQVWFHSVNGKPTAIPTVPQLQAALDAAAVARLLAALTAKFS